MSTPETPDMTAEEHAAEARRYVARAEKQPSVWDRSVDLQAAQVHATLAQTLIARDLVPIMTRVAAWVAEPETPDHPVPATGGQDGSDKGGNDDD